MGIGPSASLQAMFECGKAASQGLALGPALELLFWSSPPRALVSVLSVSRPPALQPPVICPGKVLQKERNLLFSSGS